jgi:hypothetical protein
MKLTDLNPRWTGIGGGSGIITGVTFDCPHCRTQRLGVTFKNAIDPNGWLAKGVTRHHDKNEWDREGETFETLTLTPSVDTSRADFEGHWHGYIRNGEIV